MPFLQQLQKKSEDFARRVNHKSTRRVKTWAVFKFLDLPWQVFGKQSVYQRRRHPCESQEPCSNKIRPWTLLLDPYWLNTSNFHKTVSRKPRSRQRIRIASITEKQERRKELRPEKEKIALLLLFCFGDVKRTGAIKGCCLFVSFVGLQREKKISLRARGWLWVRKVRELWQWWRCFCLS